MPGDCRHLLRTVIAAAIAASILVGSPLRAQTGEPPKLAELREKYQREVGPLAEAPLKKYREELLKLERSLAAKREYTAAAEARDERQKVEKRLASIARRKGGDAPAQPYPGGPVNLAAKEAVTTGALAYNREKDAIEGWKDKGAAARWSLPFPLKPGGYEVILEMACAPGSGGQVTVKEDFHLLTRTIAPTKGWDDFTSQSLGTLRVSGNAAGLSLAALTIEGDGLFLLRGVKLVPIADDTKQ